MKTIGGLSWPEEGFPAFLCVIKTSIKPNEDKFKTPEELITVTNELEELTVSKLLAKLKEFPALNHVYAKFGQKYITYVNEFRRWKREENSKIFLQTASVSSFEAGVLMIKDMITEGRLVFCDNSKVKAQLQVFSKLSLKNEREFYAVSALTNAIGILKKKDITVTTQPQKPQAWY